jgi:hypothetical protein
MKIEMAYISANLTGRAQPDLSIHIRTVHVDLPTVLMNNITNSFDLGLEDAESAGVCDHDSAELLAVLLTF